ncbi:hypothetical protein CDD81_3765 [Ophiocordyceps australis]|uniref:Tyrosine specific protein phosphatases domain-containing protein n=1 Tax=Ophiocordyceps australis TaxID=1399860 RepID=A0A2C5XJI6_9HYPO|nr:hypothetical protein CDD81_3765 [Ophiocordyceps australis]
MAYELAIEGFSRFFAHFPTFHDVGISINAILDKPLLMQGRLFRSGRLDGASREHKKIIRDELGIRTVVDLRTRAEIRDAKRRAKIRRASSTVPDRRTVPSDPLRIGGIHYEEVDLLSRSLKWRTFWRLSLDDKMKVAAARLTGRKALARRTWAIGAYEDLRLRSIAIDILETSGQEIVRVLRTVTKALKSESGTCLLADSEGRHRSGLVTALILLLVLEDTGESVKGIVEELNVGFKAPSWARLWQRKEATMYYDDAPEWIGDDVPEALDAIWAHLWIEHRGVANYLDGIGFHRSEQEELFNEVTPVGTYYQHPWI